MAGGYAGPNPWHASCDVLQPTLFSMGCLSKCALGQETIGRERIIPLSASQQVSATLHV